MQRITKKVTDGIAQITIADTERWYAKTIDDETTVYVPSASWISSYYPKGREFYRWLASKGWDDAEEIKSTAGDKGSRVHLACADLIAGKELGMDAEYPDKNENMQELTIEEWECLIAFHNWYKEVHPEVLASETIVWGLHHAGTVDLYYMKDDYLYISDIKTGQYVWPSYEVQLNLYAEALPTDKKLQALYKKAFKEGRVKLEVLQIGYKRNKKRWKTTEIALQPDLTRATYEIWKKEASMQRPKRLELPTTIKL